MACKGLFGALVDIMNWTMILFISYMVNLFLVKLGNERRIPFEVSAQPTISRAEAESLFLQKMKAAEDEVAKGNYKTSEEMHKIFGVFYDW